MTEHGQAEPTGAEPGLRRPGLASAPYLALGTPASSAFADRIRSIYARREDLQAAFARPDSEEFLRWVVVHGALEHEDELGEFFPAVPPAEVRFGSSHGLHAADYLHSSLEDFRTLLELVEVFGRKPISEVRSVYEFGCASGRILRRFGAVASMDCFGSDIRPADLEWCDANLPGRFLLTGLEPPVELPDDSMDLVYAVSAVSHLDRAANVKWVRELCRVCAPDGLILVSAHGAFSLFVAQRSAEHQALFHLTREGAVELLRDLGRESFALQPAPAELGGPTGPRPGYDQAFFSAEFAGESWSEFADILGHVPAAQGLLEDFYALRPRS